MAFAKQLQSEQTHQERQPADKAEPSATLGNAASAANMAPPPDAEPIGDILAAAAESLGQPLDHVRVHTDTDVAEKSGAAAVADGSDIHVHPSAVTEDGRVSASLLRHELAHVAQADKPGGGASVGALESEADQAASAMASGQSFDVSASAGGGRALHKPLSEWFSETFGSGELEESELGPEDQYSVEGSYLADGDSISSVTTEEQELLIASDAPLAADGALAEPASPDDAAGAVVEAREVVIEQAKVSLESGSVGYSRDEHTIQPVELSAEARQAVAVAELEARSSDADTRMAEARARMEEIDGIVERAAAAEKADASEPATETDQEPISTDEDKSAAQEELAAERSALEKQIAADTEVRTALNQAVQDLREQRTTLAEIEGEHEIDYTEAERKALGTKSEVSVGLDGVKAKQTTTGADGKVETDVSADLEGVGVQVKTEDLDGNSETFEGGITLDDGLGVKGGVGTEAKDGSGVEVAGEFDLVYDEEDGLQGYKAGAQYTVKDDQGREGTIALRQTMTKDEVALGGDIGGKDSSGDEKNGSSAGITVSPDVGIKLDAEPQEDGTYKLTAELYGKLGVKGEAETHGTSKGGKSDTGIEAGGSVGASFTYTRILTADEAVPYLEELEKGESDEKPEFTQWGELVAVVEGMSGDGGALNRADAAAELSAGESFAMKGEMSASLAIKGSAFGVLSAKGEIKGNGSTSLTVARSAEAVVIDAALSASLTYGGGGELVIGSGGLGLEAKETSSCGVAVHAELDPASADFQAHYEALTNATDSAELIAAAETTGARLDLSTAESFVQQIEASFGPIKVVGTETSEQSEKVVEGEDGLEGSTTHGGSGEGTKVQVGETDVVGTEEKDTLDAELQEDGLEIKVSEERSGTGPGGGEAPSVDGVLAEGLPAQLKEWLVSTEKTLETYKISPSEFEQVLQTRVPDATNWSRACWWPETVEPWYQLRDDLEGAVPVEEYAADWPEQALWLAQARALSSFMAASHSKGFECWENLLRHWGETADGVAHADDTENIGTRTEWPPGSGDAQEEWGALETAVGGLPDALLADYDETVLIIEDEVSHGPEDSSTIYPGEARCEDLRLRLDALSKALDALSFDNSSARSEMQATLDAWKVSVTDQLFEHVQDVDVLLEDAGKATSGLDGDRADAAVHDEAIEAALDRLADNKVAEEAQIDTVCDTWFASTLAEAQRELKDLWDVWIDQIKELRALYEKAGVPPEAWGVSSGPGVNRSQHREPDPEEYRRRLNESDWGPLKSGDKAAMDKVIERYSLY